jgi:hypothetical protein
VAWPLHTTNARMPAYRRVRLPASGPNRLRETYELTPRVKWGSTPAGPVRSVETAPDRTRIQGAPVRSAAASRTEMTAVYRSPKR